MTPNRTDSNMPKTDSHKLPEQAGAANKAGTAGKVKKVPKETFNASIGHGAASGGQGQLEGQGGSGDPSLKYPLMPTGAKVLPKTGKFSQAFHEGKQPINYMYGDGPEEY